MFPWRALLLLGCVFGCAVSGAPFSTNANRLAYLDGSDPFYPGLHFPKLITPQWVGEEGVDAVVILSIDDMRGNEAKYEAMLRPILERLKKIDGRAPVSIMVNTTSPTNSQLQAWLKEGVSLECHTLAHPCPLCQKGDFAAAAATYHDCVDLLASIPNNKPVAFRMPCCDSMNSPSPRFFAEIFNRQSSRGNHLAIDSSVMVVLTTNDPSLPREWVVDEQGRERFRKYLPATTNATTRVSMGSFATTIEDYPYPYVIGGTCWEFPCIVPSDWEAHNFHGSTNAATVRDWQRALDAIVLKRGVMTFIFHPHGWIRAEQLVEFIDYAVSRYGRRVKFLNFKEALDRLNGNLFAGKSLRSPDGAPAPRQLLDVDNDGLLDVAELSSTTVQITRGAMLQPSARTTTLGPIERKESSVEAWRFGVFEASGEATALLVAPPQRVAWPIRGDGRIEGAAMFLAGLPAEFRFEENGRDRGVRFRDIDSDGVCEIIEGRPGFSAIYKRGTNGWRKLGFGLPLGTSIVDEQGRDAGLRFVDIDGDGSDDVLFSNDERYSLHLFRRDERKLRLNPGWTDEVVSGKRVNPLTDPIPPVVRGGTNRNNGVWFARETMWIQNEDTAHLPDKVDRRTFNQLLSSGQPPPRSPRESLEAIRVAPGFQVELVAAEPLIASPVAFEWSADGRLWVVEMGDYPNGLDGKGQPGGRVRVLTDRDGNGSYDDAQTFLEGLNFPNGIYPWRQGVVISAAPEIFYAADTDGDGKADKRQTLFTGFVEGNQQHRVNGFDYGLDGWLYGANGDSGGRVVTASAPSAPVSIRGRDIRLHPDRNAFEAIAGQTQYGRHRDDFGNWFGNNNPTWLWHYAFPEEYLARNPLLAVKSTKRMLAQYDDGTRCFPISRLMSRFNDAHAANHVTSGCSPTPYRDTLFGPEFARSVFICEPVHNLVHREVLEPDGVTFRSHRAAEERHAEFLASSDNWFRPVFARTGPDGALYVADMYRLVIEHPEWIPVEMQKRLDLRAGADKGRIYRVAPKSRTLRGAPNLAVSGPEQLAQALDSSNGWQRDTAQRLLIERGDRAAVPAVQRVALKASLPQARLQALWTLAGLDALSTDMLTSALKDADAAVREHAVKLSEPVLHRSISRGVLERVAALASDAEPRVRFQVAFSLGETTDRRAADALAMLLADENESVRQAALSSATPHAQRLIAAVEKLPAASRARAALPMLRRLAAQTLPAAAGPKLVERPSPFTAEQRAERDRVVKSFAAVADLRADARSGRELFRQHCAQCHRSHGEGSDLGPDLGIMTGKPVLQVVEAILNPNLALDTRYQAFTVVLADGEELTGVIAAETPNGITLRVPNRGELTLLRSEMKEFSTSGVSLMPDGFEALTPQQLADVIGFILGK